MPQDPKVLRKAQLQGHLRLTAVLITAAGVSNFEDGYLKELGHPRTYYTPDVKLLLFCNWVPQRNPKAKRH